MLQILSGKFFNETISVKEFNGKEIFYSNIMMFGKIETDLWTLENVNLNQGVSSYLLTLRVMIWIVLHNFFIQKLSMNLDY